MSKAPESELLRTAQEAKDRFEDKAISLQDAYIFILTAKKSALEGHDELNKSYNELKNSVKAANMGPEQYFLSIIFLDFISEVEIYFSSLIKSVVSEYPKKLGNINFKLSEILDSTCHDELITKAADDCVYKLMYKKPYEYLDEMCGILSIDKDKIMPTWNVYIEAKARRDLGVHGSWICNATYLRKLKEADIETAAKVGDILLPSYSEYVKDLHHQLIDMARVISSEVRKKYA